MRLYIITGRSGSGKSTVLHALEDEGFMCIDNFPASLLEKFVEDTSEEQTTQDFAVSIDARSPPTALDQLPNILKSVARVDFTPRVIYLDASGPVLVKRFSETRRRHPLEKIETDLRQAIDLESKLLRHLAEMADLKIDTTQWSTHDLVLMTKERLVDVDERSVSLLFRSFAYRSGVPVDADFVFDLRCLPNPHWEAELRELSGLDEPVKEFFAKHQIVDQMHSQIVGFLHQWLPEFERQNRVYMTVATGCTGGRHRSVYMAERLASSFRDAYPNVLVRHREQHEPIS
ncbi:MAG: RNase adapter RapZ [Gammaproteobacteria bacterium]|nr:RNase adapter RapZ [Gammaproteobacteria bacterium]